MLAFSTITIGCLLFAASPYVNADEEECPTQTCLAGYQCGGQKGIVYPPGAMSLCSEDQEGGACNWCDGTTVVRLCSETAQERKCVSPENPTNCGNPKTGTCREASLPGLGTYYWCKDTGGNGTHSCSVVDQCTGDEACEQGA
jgi:hypothetical protein